MAKIIKSNSKKITQEFMDFLVLNFYESLQPKSCTCKAPFALFEFIQEIFLLETKHTESFNELIDSCPLLFKLVTSLLNHVRVFDFLAIFLGKLLKKNYLKQIAYQQIQQARFRAAQSLASNLNHHFSPADLSNVLNILSTESARNPRPWKRFESLKQVDLTKKRRLKEKKYHSVVAQLALQDDDFLAKRGNASQNFSGVFSNRKSRDVSFAYEFFDERGKQAKRKTVRYGSKLFESDTLSVKDVNDPDLLNSSYLGKNLGY